MSKLKIKRGWQERFAERINKEFAAYRREGLTEQNRCFMVGIKDCLYLLGESFNGEYKWASGFRKFKEDFGINIDEKI